MTRPMNLFLIMFFLAFSGIALADESTVPQFQNPPLKFTIHKTISGANADPKGSAVVDQLLIGDQTKEKLTFWFYLYGPNFHICSMAGNAVSVSSRTYQYTQGNCQLRITTITDGIEIEDIDGQCKAVSCGSRAYIGKTIFRNGG